MTERRVIGEGAYGCVIAPSLKCGNKELDYANKISKVMYSDNAVKELTEHYIIDNLDREQKYYLGKPEMCSIKDTIGARTAISKCNNGANFISDLSKSSLLVMNMGGINLHEFAKNIHSLPKTAENTKNMHKFWIEAHRLLLGMQTFLEHDVLHHDMKPQNVVYNEELNRLNYIDFGLMTNVQDQINNSRRSINHLAIIHWNFPLEFEFLNRDKYLKFAKKSEAKRNADFAKFVTDIGKHSIKNKSAMFKYFYNYAIQGGILNKEFLEKYLSDYHTTLLNIKTDDYLNFITKSIRSVDIYGIGITFMRILMNSGHLIHESLTVDLMLLFYSMITPNLDERITIDLLIARYEDILGSHGLLAEENVHFVDHVLKPGPAIPADIVRRIEHIDIRAIREEDASEEVLNMTPNPCPAGKEMNIITKRCIKSCKEGTIRSAKTGRCIKSKTAKKPAQSLGADHPISNISEKNGVKTPLPQAVPNPCSAGKEINPITKRCIKSCKEGSVRSAKTGRCIKSKTAKRG